MNNSPMKFLVGDLIKSLLLLPKDMLVEKTNDGFKFVLKKTDQQTNPGKTISRSRFGKPQQAVIAALIPSNGSETYLSREDLVRITKLTHKTISATVKSLINRGMLCRDDRGIFLTELGADLYKKHLEKLAKSETANDQD